MSHVGHVHRYTTNHDRYRCPIPGCWWTATGAQVVEHRTRRAPDEQSPMPMLAADIAVSEITGVPTDELGAWSLVAERVDDQGVTHGKIVPVHPDTEDMQRTRHLLQQAVDLLPQAATAHNPGARQENPMGHAEPHPHLEGVEAEAEGAHDHGHPHDHDHPHDHEDGLHGHDHADNEVNHPADVGHPHRHEHGHTHRHGELGQTHDDHGHEDQPDF